MRAVVLRAEISNVARIQLHILRWLSIRQRRGFLFEKEYPGGICGARYIAVDDWNFPSELLGAFLMHRERFLAHCDARRLRLHQNQRQTWLFSPAGGYRRNQFPG